SGRLGLPLKFPLEKQDLQSAYVDLPKTLYPGGAGGSIDISQKDFFSADPPTVYSFGFGIGTLLDAGDIREAGKMFGARFVTRIHPFGVSHVAEENEILSHGKSLVDTNGAYQLATNWLNAIQVDVLELEKTNRPAIQQRWFYGSNGVIKLPVFYVK